MMRKMSKNSSLAKSKMVENVQEVSSYEYINQKRSFILEKTVGVVFIIILTP